MSPTSLNPQSEGQEAQAVSSPWSQRGTGHRMESEVPAYYIKKQRLSRKSSFYTFIAGPQPKLSFVISYPLPHPLTRGHRTEEEK